MYYRYFGLQEAPFSIAVNPRYLFMSARHRDALAHLLYGVGQGGGFILLTGQVGTGKTTINRSLLEQLPDNTDIALVLNPALNAIELLATVCDELGIQYTEDEQTLKKLTDKLHHYLLENFAQGRNTVLLIDEAQHLQFDVLEQIRLLTNLETNTKNLLQSILVGQPELQTLLAKPELSQLAQRITARYQLKPLNLAETEAYIRHRLQVAGLPASQRLFKPKVIDYIFKISGGVPRIINVLCDRMLLGCYGKNKSIVDMEIAKQAAEEVIGDEPELKPLTNNNYKSILAISAVLIAVSLLAAWQWHLINSHKNLLATTPTTANTLEKLASNDNQNNTIEAEAVEAQNPSNQPIKTSRAWYNNQKDAIAALLNHLGLQHEATLLACSPPPTSALRCENLQVDSWQALQKFDHPVVLSLISPGKTKGFAVLIAINQQQATLLFDDVTETIPLEKLGLRWTGDLALIWQAPPAYSAPLSRGDSNLTVRWLAQQFAALDQQSEPLTDTDFSENLAQRIMIFQRNHQLIDDGVVGLKTILKLNQVMGLAPRLQLTPSDSNLSMPQTSDGTHQRSADQRQNNIEGA